MMKRINNVNVWGLESSVIASNYPMNGGAIPDHSTIDISEKDLKRAKSLGRTAKGSGHDCFLKGVIVQFDWKISQTIFPQVERYHFIDIVSSQSKMHKLDTATRKDFNGWTDPVILNRFLEMVGEYNTLDPFEEQFERKEVFNRLVYSCPMGYEMTARFTTNYLQLKTIYDQRSHHKLEEWQNFCRWIESLPYFREWTNRGHQ